MSDDELREKIARALDEVRDDLCGFNAEEMAESVLPIVEAEVRKAKAEALRDAADSVHDNAASPYCLPCHRDDADLLRTIADQIEKETTR
ncbi:hypothetical protein C1N80_06285 [Brachybacterium sp. SGAir0954]|uniref:hypothetical protein n=1 Tax=Brachybacterium sp. SGAir0954 TaxID=2571029 RepID=UPI0010CCEAA8|nr:hypothetical protein [Brachybacterium sp. SGAir0954]QCR53228.1 hypothetical protein C1N80_06285 [Brachybacterium sp. SGAir0954]